MSIPPQGPWDTPRPLDPSELPPGFYFPPGTGPNKPPEKKGPGGKWLLAVLVALLVIAMGVGFVFLVMAGG